MDGGSKHRATQRNKASQPAKKAAQGWASWWMLSRTRAARLGAGRGTPTAHDETNRDAARTVALGFVQVSSRQSVE